MQTMTKVQKGVPLRLSTPCKHCPFRSDVPPYLTRERAIEIANATFEQRRPFNCHKTLDYSDDDAIETAQSQNCAGAVILAEKIGKPSQIAQVALRLGLWSPECLDMRAPVFDTVEQFVDAQSEPRKRGRESE